ncbi:MAG: acetoacetate decarboxylase [Gammaproteobacteria bacterium CG11_big_fil_rev_8_21_14_0_20_46_22]|nr:MAG: acetoacetate decarboxylase [Gammaproteobacteria bacterium CG12_big_fil_rev_8_21_14_0_65_46_12]PIR10673.1 MAG: acetoacetate decarboxylase [Gammaproteobacteria bacterium CG11_big_fil_rev_8_21_14_0_20_46_22]
MKHIKPIYNTFGMPIRRGITTYPEGPYRFVNREYMIITYETDPDALKAVLPECLTFDEPIVKFEFIRMPDSTGFGDYTESGQVIPVAYEGKKGGYVHSMYLDCHAPIAGGREIWGFPKKLANPSLKVEADTLLGTLYYGPVCVAVGTMGYKYQTVPNADVLAVLHEPNYLVKLIPDVDGGPKICQLVEYHLTNIDLKGAWRGPGALELFQHALAPVANLPVKEVISALHFVADLTLPYGKVVKDFLVK